MSLFQPTKLIPPSLQAGSVPIPSCLENLWACVSHLRCAHWTLRYYQCEEFELLTWRAQRHNTYFFQSFFFMSGFFNMFGFLSYFNFNRTFCFYSCEAHPKAEISIIQKESLFLSLNFTSHNKVYRLFCFQTCIIDYFLWILMNITKIKKHCKLLINCFPLQTNLHLAGMGESFSVFFFFSRLL